MPRYICKLEDMYFEWSTVVDAPVTYGLSYDDFVVYYNKEYGVSNNLSERMVRVEDNGNSSLDYEDIDDLFTYNCAGPNGEYLTKSQIIKMLKGFENEVADEIEKNDEKVQSYVKKILEKFGPDNDREKIRLFLVKMADEEEIPPSILFPLVNQLEIDW